MRYGAILIDIPAPYNRKNGQGVAHRQYDLMRWVDLNALGPLVHGVAAPDCAILLWHFPPLLAEQHRMVQAWDLRYITKAFTWVKIYADGGLYVGLGSHSRGNTEDVWLLSNGTPKRHAADVSQVVMEVNPAHSQKPEEVARRIEALYPGPYLELFARRNRPGWTCLGNEIDGRDIRDALRDLARAEQPPVVVETSPQMRMFSTEAA